MMEGGEELCHRHLGRVDGFDAYELSLIKKRSGEFVCPATGATDRYDRLFLAIGDCDLFECAGSTPEQDHAVTHGDDLIFIKAVCSRARDELPKYRLFATI